MQLMGGEVLDTKDCPNGIRRKLSTNARNQKKKIREKFGIKIPRNMKEALLLDKKNGDSKWAEAICKKIDLLEWFGVFQYHDARTNFHWNDGWQYAPMHMISNISVRLMMLVAAKYGLGMISGDIGNSFYKVPCAEKICSVAGE
eukprot:723517-Ditylum_brightwellii.AAC.1